MIRSLLSRLFYKASPAFWIVEYVNGKARKAGRGGTYFISPWTTIARVPTTEQAFQYAFTELTADGQQIVVQGELQGRLVTERVLERRDFTIDPVDDEYLTEDPERLASEAAHALQTYVRREVQGKTLREALAQATTLQATVLAAIRRDTQAFTDLGIEVVNLFVTSVAPANRDLTRALEAEARERMLADADRAVAERRQAAATSDRTLKAYEADTAKQLEEQRTELVAARNTNVRLEADADADAMRKRLAVFDDMDSAKLFAHGFREMAANGRVGSFNVTPEALEELLRRHHSRDAVRFFLSTRGQSLEEYEAAHGATQRALETVRRSFPTDVPHTILSRELVANYLFRPSDLIVAIGPDGLCVNVAKYLNGQPILGVNPDPGRIDGVLMRVRPEQTSALIRQIMTGKAAIDRATIAKATTNDGQTLYAMNDFLVGRRDLMSSRYALTRDGHTERQSSSGVLICTGVGSTGWMKSVAAGAAAMTGTPVTESLPFPWEDRSLLYAVREPFPSRSTGTRLVFGRIREGDSITLSSEMPEGGALVSDGVLEDAIEWNAGVTVTVAVAEKVASLVRPN